MTALGICPSALFSSECRQEFLSSLFCRCYSSASRGLKSTFSRVNNIFRTLILFFRVVPELLHIPHVDLHHRVAHCFILSVITARRKIGFFFTSFPLPQNLFSFNVATIWMWCFLPDSDSINILFSDFIYTFKVRYDNISIIPKIYSYPLTT